MIKAWSVWIEGRLAPSDIVFGVPIFWWGRVGKAADFLAAFLLLWDAGTSTWARAFSAWLRDSKVWWNHPGNLDPEPRKPRGAGFAISCLVGGGFVFGVSLASLLFGDRLIAWDKWADATFPHMVTILFVIFTLLLEIGIGAFIGFVIYELLILILFWLTEAPRLSSRGRLVALCLLLLGVHFSLLAS